MQRDLRLCVPDSLNYLRAACVDDLRKGIDHQFCKALPGIDDKVADEPCLSLAGEEGVVGEAGYVCIELLVLERGEQFLLDRMIGKTESRGGTTRDESYLIPEVRRLGEQFGMVCLECHGNPNFASRFTGSQENAT
jgi:hypothetical protein